MQPFRPGNQYISFKHLEASSALRLEAEMLQIQVTAKKPVDFTPPAYNIKTNKYETWYLHDFAKDIAPKKKIELNNKVDV